MAIKILFTSSRIFLWICEQEPDSDATFLTGRFQFHNNWLDPGKKAKKCLTIVTGIQIRKLYVTAQKLWLPGLWGCPPALWPEDVLQRGQISDHLGWEAARLPSGQRLPFREVRYVITWVGRLLACPLARGCPSERSDSQPQPPRLYNKKKEKKINNRTIVHNQYF